MNTLIHKFAPRWTGSPRTAERRFERDSVAAIRSFACPSSPAAGCDRPARRGPPSRSQSRRWRWADCRRPLADRVHRPAVARSRGRGCRSSLRARSRRPCGSVCSESSARPRGSGAGHKGRCQEQSQRTTHVQLPDGDGPHACLSLAQIAVRQISVVGVRFALSGHARTTTAVMRRPAWPHRKWQVRVMIAGPKALAGRQILPLLLQRS